MWSCFGVIVLLAWGYLYVISPQVSTGNLFLDTLKSLCSPFKDPWAPSGIALAFAMWAAMVLAMMLPSAAPMVSTYSDIAQQAFEKDIPAVRPFVLILGYVFVWFGFSVAATLGQSGLQTFGLLNGDEALGSDLAAAMVLAIAGGYQFSNLKHACLSKCRHPMPYFLANWTDRRSRVFTMGMTQGAVCIGCCWALMLVMFVTGLMNLTWMAIVGLVMILEKTLSDPRPVTYGTGAILSATAVVYLFQAVGL